MTATLTPRTFGTFLTVAGVSAQASAGASDPISAALEAVRSAEDELMAAIRGLDEADAMSVQIAYEVCDRRSDARDALSRVLPTTPAGLRALVRFHADDVMGLDPDSPGALALRDVLMAVDGFLQARVSPG